MLILFIFMVSCVSSYNLGAMQGVNALGLSLNHSRVHYDTLILSDHARSNERGWLGLNISFSNHSNRSNSYVNIDKQLSKYYNQLQNNPRSLEAFEYLKVQTRTDIERVMHIFDQLSYTSNHCDLKVVDSLLQLREVMPHDAILQKYYHTALEVLKPIISDSNGRLKETFTSSEMAQIKNIAYDFSKAARRWYEDIGILEMAQCALGGSVDVPRSRMNGSIAAAVSPSAVMGYHEISYLKSTKFDEIFKDILLVNDLHALKVCKSFCKEELAGISPTLFIEKINSPEYAQDRALLAKFGQISTHTTESRMQLERYMRYTQQGCSNLEYADACRLFGRALANEQLTHNSQMLSAMNDYSVPAPNKFQDVIRQKILAVFAQHIPALQDREQTSRISTLFAKIDTAYGKMIKGDWKAQLLLENTFIPHFCEEVLDLDLNKIVDSQFSENRQLFSECLNEFAQAKRDIHQNGIQDTCVDYAPDTRTGFYMFKERKLNLREYFGKIEGNQLDHACHRVILANFKTSAELHYQGINESRKALFEVANRSNELVRSFVKIRDYGTAMNLSVFAHRALEYIKSAHQAYKDANQYYGQIYKEAYINMGLGVVDGVKNVSENVGTFIAHPIDSSIEIAQRLNHFSVILLIIALIESVMLEINFFWILWRGSRMLNIIASVPIMLQDK